MHIKPLLVTALLAASLPGCAESTNESAGNPPSKTHDWLLTSAPGEATSVANAKNDAREGERVTVRGRIGGRIEPISPDSAVFTIVDLDVPHCGQMEMDEGCKTPWDYCCEPRDNLTANSATVLIVGQDGQALDTNPTAAGLDPLDEVVVVGTVAPRPDAQVLTIRASGVYRVP